MLSGIGPAAHLKQLKIPVIRDLQVGKNLQDHPSVMLLFGFDKSEAVQPLSVALMEFLRYLTERKGSFYDLGAAQTAGYLNTYNTSSPYPNFQILFNIGHKGQATIPDTAKLFGYNDYFIQFTKDTSEESGILALNIVLFDEKSRGEILLRSNNTMVKPRIIPNFLAEKYDVEEFVKVIRFNLNFMKTAALKKHKPELIRVPIPECDTLEYLSDEYWTCYCRYLSTTTFHQVGTAKMGPDSDPNAVVDSRLRVKGTKGLRVIDASIMPRITRGNTNVPTIMIGEKGADFIKQDWGSSGNFDFREFDLHDDSSDRSNCK